MKLVFHIILIVSALMVTVEIQHGFFRNLLQGEKEKLDLAVCILSARENFEQRQGIRESWLNDLYSGRTMDKRKAKALFVIGEKSCSIHPHNRIDAYECTYNRWNFSKADASEVIAAFHSSPTMVSNNKQQSSSIQHAHRLSVKVLHPVTIKRLGVAERLVASSSLKEAVLCLFDGPTEEEIVCVKYSEHDSGILHNSFLYQPIQPVLLPKGFECELSMDNMETDIYGTPNRMFLTDDVIMNAGGALIIEGMNTDRTYITDRNFTSLISFIYSVENTSINELKTKADNSHQKDVLWQEEQRDVDDKLLKEKEHYSDMLMVDVVDVYRNLPKKLLACHEWISENADAMYIMKTDDDCFVNIDWIFQYLPSTVHKKMWWGKSWMSFSRDCYRIIIQEFGYELHF